MIGEIIKQDFDTRVKNMDVNVTRNELVKKRKCNDRFHVVYVMSNTTICGAAKIIFQHANRLMEKGVKVTIVAYFNKPSWFNIECDYIQAPFTTKLAMCIPQCDLIIATYYTHIGECIKTRLAPVIYFEQGDFHIFCYDRLKKNSKEFINLQFQLANDIMTVSNQVVKLIKKIFKQDSHVIHNAIDKKIYNNKLLIKEEKYMLMMGSDKLEFKGIKDIIVAYSIVKKYIPDLRLYWITPVIPSSYDRDLISKIYISPNQKKISKLYNNAELFINASYYESFSLPTIEAMACGCPVITTDCIGIRDYVVNNENALITSHNPYRIASKIVELMSDELLQSKLIKNGLKTVERFDWEVIIDKLYEYYSEKSIYEVKNTNKIGSWKIWVRQQDFQDDNEYQKFLKILETTEKGKVFVPVKYKITDDYYIARWSEVAYKIDSNNCEIEYCYTLVNGDISSIKDDELKELYRLIEEKNYSKAIIFLEDQESIVYKRWLIFCLIKLKEFTRAIEIINSIIDSNIKKYSDIYYLQLLIPQTLDDRSKIIDIINNINILGDGIIYEEFIVDIIGLTTKFISDIDKEEKLFKMEETYNYALRLYDNRLYDEAIGFFKEFINNNDGCDKERIIEAYRKIYNCYYYKNMYDECRTYCYMTFKYTLPRAEECCFIGYAYLQEKKYEDAAFWFELATTLEPPRKNEYQVIDEDAWTWKPYVELCICYYNMGKVKKAFEYNELAKSINPTNEDIIKNVEFFKNLGYESNELVWE